MGQKKLIKAGYRLEITLYRNTLTTVELFDDQNQPIFFPGITKKDCGPLSPGKNGVPFLRTYNELGLDPQNLIFSFANFLACLFDLDCEEDQYKPFSDSMIRRVYFFKRKKTSKK